jgi:hypothetical protein
METTHHIDQVHIDSDMFDQWETYPDNESLYDPIEFNLELYAERLHDDASRLLSDSTNVDVLAVRYSTREGEQ